MQILQDKGKHQYLGSQCTDNTDSLLWSYHIRAVLCAHVKCTQWPLLPYFCSWTIKRTFFFLIKMKSCTSLNLTGSEHWASFIFYCRAHPCCMLLVVEHLMFKLWSTVEQGWVFQSMISTTQVFVCSWPRIRTEFYTTWLNIWSKCCLSISKMEILSLDQANLILPPLCMHDSVFDLISFVFPAI